MKWLFFAKLKQRGRFGSDLDVPMAYAAKRDEIFFNISSQLAAALNVMNLKTFEPPHVGIANHRAGALALRAPDIPWSSDLLSGIGKLRRLRYPHKNSWRWEFGSSR